MSLGLWAERGRHPRPRRRVGHVFVGLPIAVVLAVLLATTMLASETGEEGDMGSNGWITSDDLLAADGSPWTPLDAATRDSLLPDRRSGWERAYVIDYLEDEGHEWLVHQGDLAVDSSLKNGHALIVLGDLTIRGSYDDFSHDSHIGLLLVLGDLRVEHVASWGTLHVEGALRAEGLVFAYYNDFTFQVSGPLEARMVVIDDKASSLGQPFDGVMLNSSLLEIDEESLEQSLLQLRPELLEIDLFEGGLPGGWWPSFDETVNRLQAGKRLFRDTPADRALLDNLEEVLAEGTAADRIDELAFAGPLLQLAAAYWCEDLTRKTVEKMIDQGDPKVLTVLAVNDSVPRSLRRAAKKRLQRLQEACRDGATPRRL